MSALFKRNETLFATGEKHGLNIQKIRNDFPMLSRVRNGKPLIYFDSAATNHKPMAVIDKLNRLYTSEYGKPQEQHAYSQKMTKEIKKVRGKIADFIGAKKRERDRVYVGLHRRY